MKARIPHSHLTYVFGAAHALELDQPELVVDVIRALVYDLRDASTAT